MYKKGILKKMLTAVLAASMTLSTTGCGSEAKEMTAEPVVLMEENEGEITDTIEDSLGLSDKKDCDKNETVYVFADSTGNVNDVIVEEWLKNAEGSEVLNDESGLTDIENVKGDETFTQKGNEIEWQAGGQDIYYQGHSSEKVPVEVKVSYTLDGKPVSAEEIAGKSGKVTIRFDYKNNSKDGEIYTPFAMATGLLLDSENFSDVTVDNGKVISDGDRYVVVGMGMPGLSESLGLDEDEAVVPEYFEVTANASDFSYDMAMTIATTDLLASDKEIDPEELEETLDEMTGEYKGGMDKLSSGIEEYTNGVGQLGDGIDKLSAGTDKLNQGAAELSGGADKLAEGSKNLSSGITAAKNGSEQVTGGAEKLGAGADQLASGMAEYTDGVASASEGADKLNSGAAELENGALQLQVGSKDLEDGVISYTQGVSDAKDGADSISYALKNQVMPGLYNESAENPGLVQGINSLDAGLADMQSQVGGMFATLHGKQEEIYSQTGGAPDAGNIEALKGAVKQSADTYAAAYGQVYASVFSATYSQAVADGMDSDAAAAAAAEAAASAAASNENVLAAAAAVSQYSAQLSAYSQAYGADATISTILGYEGSFTEGVGQLKGGADRLSAGSMQLYGGLQELSKGADSLSSGMHTLDENSEVLRQGAKSIKEGIMTLKAGAGELRGGIGTLNDGLGQLKANNDKLNSGIQTLSAGAGELKSGSAQVTDGLGQLEAGAGQLSTGLDSLDKGAGTLRAGTDELSKGAGQLKAGSDKLTAASPELVKGSKQLNDATEMIMDKLADKEEDLNKLTDRVNSLREAGYEYQSFGGKKDDASGSVKFIIKTEGVATEE